MTIPANQLHDLPILSLETSEPVGHTIKPIVRMDNLQVVALRCAKTGQRSPFLLLTSDIRQLTIEYLIINSETDLLKLDDVVRLRDIVAADFDPIGRTVVSEGGHHHGVVRDYHIDGLTALIRSILVGPRLFASASKTTLIHREQIVDVTPKRIVVQDAIELDTASPMVPDIAA
ncbi:MAG TPA: PRC-barrel domain-containing protein [Candidatus Saccharimonadia bacterium]